MPSKYSHSVVLASYSRRGIISLPNDEKVESRKGRQAPRILAGKPPPLHESVFTVKPGGRASSRSSYHARWSTLQPTFPTHSQQNPKEEVSNNVRSKGAIHGIRPSTNERKVILDSESEEIANGTADDFCLRSSGPSNGKPPTSSRLSTPFDPYIESQELTLERDPSGANAKPANHISNGTLARGKKLPLPVAAQKDESSRGFRGAAQPTDRDGLQLHRRPRPRPHGDTEMLFSARDPVAPSPQIAEVEDAVHSRKQFTIPRKAVPHNDTIRHAPVIEAADQIPKLQKPRRPSLSRANTSFIDLSDDEISVKSRGHTPHTSLGKSPSTHTLISDVEVQGSTTSNLADDLRDLHDGVAFRARQGRGDKLGNAATWKGGLTEPKVRRRPVSLGSGYIATLPVQKRAPLRRRQTEEPMRHSISRSPVLESQNLSWLLLDVGLNNQMKEDSRDEAPAFPQITLQLPKSEVRAEVILGSSAAQPSLPRLEPVEADFFKPTDSNENGKPHDLQDSATTNTYFHGHSDSVHRYPPHHGTTRKMPPPLSPSLSSRRGEESLWSPISARSEPTSVESGRRHQHTFSNISSCSVAPETQPQAGMNSLASSGKARLKPKLKSEEEMRMKIPTPIPSPALPAMSPKISGRRIARSSSGSAHQASRPTAMPEFGMPSVVRYDDESTHIDEHSKPRPASRLGAGTPQQQKAGSETIRDLASVPRFPRMASTPRQGKDATPASATESYQQDNDDWMFPYVPVSKKAASRASLLESLVASVEAESRLESKGLGTWHANSSNLSSQFQNVTSQTRRSGDMDDIISLFSNDHEIPVDVRDDYAQDLNAAGDEIEDPDAALPPPDISRHRADRSSSRNGQYRRSQSSLTALPYIVSANISRKRLSRAKWEDATKPMPWAWNVNPAAPMPARAEISLGDQEKRPRMRTGMKALWGRLRRCIES
ncbi:uncharacterized protein Z520_09201 [Fonsecaea multimorphosa CBS 102226]|uniref:Uncharacterized protein n=1 Tax=Fonsecaea multimorphosa CBS 102226 TaxID=1442371 RepID=A0A0D2JNH7_9EURO|nr:uncharacterized protein Z520_09201 [Fonsecaea multimorphosa CBS 102226]KIX94892.1 hypothetical protein Z520_09201 [Fonsecaea multimorphosa CBS 102226]OAL20783.1 hypothetical protein AYO22_08553 [Fonsecaea multimorphosa]